MMKQITNSFELNEHLEKIREEINRAFFHNSCVGNYKSDIEERAVCVENALNAIKKEIVLAEKYIKGNKEQ